MATRRWIQDRITGELREVKPQHKGIANTFQVGDLPDIQKDVASRKEDQRKADARHRKETLIRHTNEIMGLG